MAININPFLQFNGNCRAAFEFYKDAFGGDFTEEANKLFYALSEGGVIPPHRRTIFWLLWQLYR